MAARSWPSSSGTSSTRWPASMSWATRSCQGACAPLRGRSSMRILCLARALLASQGAPPSPAAGAAAEATSGHPVLCPRSPAAALLGERGEARSALR
eukprot:13566372-Alexandrium_andersonii.AAC.1